MFSDQFEELLVVRNEELGELSDEEGRHPGLGSPLAGAETLGPDTTPLRV